jgi:hypothetical protein
MLKRYGRFQVVIYNDDYITLEVDHANGSPSEYVIPHMSVRDAEDLIYALGKTIDEIKAVYEIRFGRKL